MNIIMKWILSIGLFIDNPVIKGNQWTNPANTANTAPIDKT